MDKKAIEPKRKAFFDNNNWEYAVISDILIICIDIFLNYTY